MVEWKWNSGGSARVGCRERTHDSESHNHAWERHSGRLVLRVLDSANQARGLGWAGDSVQNQNPTRWWGIMKIKTKQMIVVIIIIQIINTHTYTCICTHIYTHVSENTFKSKQTYQTLTFFLNPLNHFAYLSSSFSSS